ncbi:hypothetical protein [Nonomuraea sp. SBT364]|uniref:hypothetical protein n=1 Tax=Nonomuraea sp. SBT364 TaxID=1580530 RepID=UPI00066E0BD7|nr:hypothetical protein [Nonomuraea sp. SBT364]
MRAGTEDRHDGGQSLEPPFRPQAGPTALGPATVGPPYRTGDRTGGFGPYESIAFRRIPAADPGRVSPS